ncbi:hypothetical protein P5673_002635 [Acropora cervicornis]|uniref:Uncharacterized protein n=1 Tax=Acropora cervicornis TaxID=6130 RepID=A0AAD9R3Z9_ACRCE|nr:hypothetical protein P5673_002635 [Acropora cervicornis]
MPDTWTWWKAVLAHEFRIKSFFLRFSRPELFSESPWFPPTVFLIYRLVATSWCVFITAGSVFRYLTYLWLLQFENWSLSAVCAYYILSTFLLIYSTLKRCRENRTTIVEPKYKEKTEENYLAEVDEASDSDLLWIMPGYEEVDPRKDFEDIDELSCYHKTIWLLQTLAQNSIVVVILCGVLLYNHEDSFPLADYLSLWFVLFMEAIFCFAPIRLVHVVYAYLFTLFYALVVFVLYFVIDVYHDLAERPRFLHRIRDNSSSIVALIFLIIGQPLFQMFYFLVHKINIYLYIKDHGY